ERLHDVVAVRVAVRVAPLLLEYVALVVGIAGDVEPVAAPALAVGRRSEIAIDEDLEGARPRIVDERLDLFRRRRQTAEVELDATQQRPAIGLRIRRQSRRLEPSEDERVDGRRDPRGILGGGNRWTAHGLESPVFLLPWTIGGKRLARGPGS